MIAEFIIPIECGKAESKTETPQQPVVPTPDPAGQRKIQDMEEQKSHLNSLIKAHQQDLDLRDTAFHKLDHSRLDIHKQYNIFPQTAKTNKAGKQTADKAPAQGAKGADDKADPGSKKMAKNLFQTFSKQQLYIFSDLWHLDEKFSAPEINLYTKKLQYLNTLINESYKDVIFCAAVCTVPVIVQFIFSNFIQSTVKALIAPNSPTHKDFRATYSNLANNYDMLGEMPGLYLNLNISQATMGLASEMSTVIIWEGLQEVLLIFTKLYHLRLFDVSDYEEDIQKDVKRLKTQGHLNPYERHQTKKAKYPDHAIRFSRFVLYLQIYYNLVKFGLRVLWHLIGAASYLSSFVF